MLAGSAHKTLRDFLSSLSAHVALMEINDPGLDLDLDTPADYSFLLSTIHKLFVPECPYSRDSFVEGEMTE